jgi:hypothetical protein
MTFPFKCNPSWTECDSIDSQHEWKMEGSRWSGFGRLLYLWICPHKFEIPTIFRTYKQAKKSFQFINTMKFTRSFCFLAAFSAAPTTVLGAHHNLRTADSVAGETHDQRTDRQARPVSAENHGNRKMRESERQILMTSDRRTSSRAHEDREFNPLIVGGNTASVGEYPYFGKFTE